MDDEKRGGGRFWDTGAENLMSSLHRSRRRGICL